ncbi:hypothetical protein AXY43_13325 [Clostridium sp. MF28]|uniref:restriction endonuclease subunit S n=1 Tax=Clostridium TaxID=1485 RepID=UPI000D228E7A|nr:MULTISPECIES: restriction endonuclease subunit S [Clostridium]AVK48925.1 hypothetical protein AXY43_13325 [Clostridium sp. MF28]
MSDIKFKDIKINELLKTVPIVKKLKYEELITDGDIPVYSAETKNNGIIGYYNTATFHASADKPLIVFGDHTRAVNVVYTNFSVMDNVKVLDLKHSSRKLCLEYIKYQWRNKIPNLGYSRHWKVAKDVEISIPINEDGTFDFEYQQNIAEKYKKLEDNKKLLLDDKQRLLNSSIDIDLSIYPYKEINLGEIFDLSQTSNGSKFTKTFIKSNPGNIPVYGASKFEEEVSYGYVKDNAEIVETKNGKKIITKVRYFEDCLTYNIDGTAGYVFYRKGKFSLSEKVKPLIIVNTYKDYIDENYLKYILQPIFRMNTRGRKGPNGENEFSKIGKNIIQDLFIPIPVKEDGKFDLETQKLIANKYKKAETIKNALCKQIDETLKITIEM